MTEIDIKEKVRTKQPKQSKKVFEMNFNDPEQEIVMVKNGKSELMSPIPEIKVIEEDVSVNLTPANKSIYFKSRNSSVDAFVNRSMDLSSKIRTRRAGAAIGDLVSKLRSTRKFRGAA